MKNETTLSAKVIPVSIIIIAGFIIILLRLWQLQVVQGSEYRKTAESNRLRVIGIPAPRGIIYDRNGLPLVKDTPFFIASVIPAEISNKHFPLLAEILDMPVDEVHKKVTESHRNPEIPIRLKEPLNFEEVSFLEARRSDVPGLIIEVDLGRKYLYGQTASHLIGYLGKLSPKQAADPVNHDVPPTAFIGQWGVEKLFDKRLRGIAGKKVYEVDALGREIRLFQEQQPIEGKDLTLSVDIALQLEVEKAFEGKTGAFVALKPDTGEILSLVSSPSFDPNKFTHGITYEAWQSLMQDRKFPMLNRAIQSTFPPGSIFKIITAVAALEEGVINEETTVNCSGSIKYGNRKFRCWKRGGHGRVSIHRALVESCDVFFYEIGKRLGIDTIHTYASKFGLGSKTGFPFGNEKEGLIPNTTWKIEKKKTKWFLGETFINAIGQGYVSITPIQAALMTSMLANNGTSFAPQILIGGDPEKINKIDLSPQTIRIVSDSLMGVVHEKQGTGKAARSDVITIAGKTGTAQVVSIRKDSKDLPEHIRDHAWFVAYAPVEKPEIALAVFVEHGGHGGTAAAPIAKRAVESYLLRNDHERKQ
jgi:penicillin-binding protein 2